MNPAERRQSRRSYTSKKQADHHVVGAHERTDSVAAADHIAHSMKQFAVETCKTSRIPVPSMTTKSGFSAEIVFIVSIHPAILPSFETDLLPSPANLLQQRVNAQRFIGAASFRSEPKDSGLPVAVHLFPERYS